MTTQIFLLTVLIVMFAIVVITNARPDNRNLGLSFGEDGEAEIGYEERDRQNIKRGRRTRHSRQTANWYNSYQSESYEHRKLLLLDQILFELKMIKDELSIQSRQPQVAIPYPFYYPYLWPSLPLKCKNNSASVHNRDSNEPIWGDGGDATNDPGNNDDNDYDDDGSRDISLKPVAVKVPAPPVEHGSFQAEKTTARPSSSEPSICEASIIYCCRYEEPQRKECFESLKCSKTYSTGVACLPAVVKRIIKKFGDAYGPR